MKTTFTSILFFVFLLSHPLSFGDSPAVNWHQWRGPDATGLSRTATPPVRWSEDKNVKWKVAIDGAGTSTPIIWNDRIFLLTAIDTGVKDSSIPDPKDQPKSNFFDIGQLSNIYASPVGAAGRIYITGRGGNTLVIQRSRTFAELASNHLDDRFDASPALAGNQLFLRGASSLYCIEEESESTD
mgnify:CR=1 FL=1